MKNNIMEKSGKLRENMKKLSLSSIQEIEKQIKEKLRSSDLELRKANELNRLLGCSSIGDHTEGGFQGRKSTLFPATPLAWLR